MNTFTKSVALAAVMMTSAGLTPQFTRAQATGHDTECNGQIGAPLGCAIVADSSYNSVRTISYSGSTYTYKAQGLTNNYQVSVNARRGKISSTALE
ncbi:MAG: hypothetical protein ABIN69_14915 [Aestuariivirga sp.]|jgi:uncharacterized membrane protein YdfJ with MMPL/SSD domain